MKKFIMMFVQWVFPCLLFAHSGDFCNFYIRSGFDSECIITSYKPNSSPQPNYEEHECLVACRGSQVIYSIVGLPSVASFDWAVSGADSYTTNTSDNTITVNWSETAGIGTLILSVYGQNDEFCEKQLCVDLIERPVAGIASNPTEAGHTPSGVQYIDVCDGQEIQFYDNSTSSSDSPIVGYYWKVGAETASTQNYTFIADYNTYGNTATIYHHVINECGCEDVIKYIVNISKYPTLEVDCFGTAGENTSATYHAINSCTDYMWYVEGGHIQGGQGTSSLTVMWDEIDNGYGYVALNGSHCEEGECPYLTYLPIPVISDNAEIQGPDVVCVGDIVYFELPLWASTEYNWSIVYTNPSDVRVLFSGHRHKYLVEFRNPGTYTIKCIYNCGFLGCGGVAQAKTVVVTKPFGIIADREACAGESVTFETDYPTEVFDWTIYHNGTSIYTQTASTISYTFNTAGGYTIEASSPNFCNTAYASININALPPTPQPDVSGWTNRICLNGSSTYSATPPSPEYYLHWSATCGNPSEYDGNDYNVTFQSLPCTVNLQYVNRNTGCSSLPYQYQVSQFVPQTINWPAYEVCANEIFPMSVTPENQVQYAWSIIDGNANIVTPNDSCAIDVQVNAFYGQMSMVLTRNYCNNIYIDDTIPVTVKPYLIPEISMPSSICQYGTAVISADNTEQFNGIWTLNVEGSSYNSGLTSGATWNYTFNNVGTIPVRMGYQTPGCTNVYEKVETIEVIPAPQFSLSYYVQGNNNYLINATVMDPNATGYTYAWNPNVGTGPSFVHNGSSFNYTCTVTDITTGCTGSKNISIASSSGFNPEPNCSYQENNASVVITSRNCNSITFTHNSALAGNSEWAFGQNVSTPQITLSGTNNSVCTATFSSSGYYRVVAGRMYNGCMYTASLQFYVPLIPRFYVGYSCATGTVINLELEDISDYMTGTVINSTTWYIDGVPVSNPSSCAVTSGTHTVMLTVNYTYGNITESCSTTQTVTYNRGTAAFTVSSGPYCSGTGIQFTDISTNAIAWDWQFSNEQYSMDHNRSQNPEHTFTNSNSNSNSAIPALIVLQTQDNLGCYSQAYNTLQLYPNKLSGIITSQQFSVCYGNPWTINFIHSTTPTTSPVYRWHETNQTTYVPSNNFYESGSYYVRITDNHNCYYQSKWYSIGFTSSPVAEIYGDADYCPDGEITLIGESGDNTYQWTGIGSYPITTPNLTATIASYALSPGNYTVTLTVTKDGCSSTDTKAITIHPTPATPSIGFGANRCLHIPPVNLISTTSQNLHWSTGDYGTSTETYNAGYHTAYYTDPTTGCRSAEAEIDVPKPPDFNELMSGCFEFCKDDFTKYLLGPGGEFDYWEWYYYNTVIYYGTGMVSPPPLQVPTYGTYHLDVDYATYCSTTSGKLVVSQKEVCDSCDLVVSLLKEPWCDVKDCKLRVFFYLNIYNPALNSATLYGVNSPNIGTLYSPVLPVTINPGTTATLLFEIELANYEPQDMYLQLLFYDGHFHPCDYDFFVDISDVLDNCISQNCKVKVGQFEYLGTISSAGMAYFGYHFFMSMGMSNVMLYSDDVTIIDVNYNSSTGEISGLLSITPLELQQLIADNKTICFKLYACYNDKICKLEFCVPASDLQIIGSKSVDAEDDSDAETGEVPNMDEPLSPLTPDFCLYPNPATSSVSISGDNFSRATVIDMGGKVVMEVYDTTFNIGTLRNGEYIVKVVSLDGAIQYLKLIKR